MQELYKQNKQKGFTILAFPCNQFGGQEPKSEAEIKEFVKKFNVDFPLFSKINVNGPKTHSVFEFLKKAFPGDVTWNFAGKFLVDRQGIPVRRFGKSDKFTDIEQVIQAILIQEDQSKTVSHDDDPDDDDDNDKKAEEGKKPDNRRRTRSMAAAERSPSSSI